MTAGNGNGAPVAIPEDATTGVTAAMDRRNGTTFLLSWVLIYLAAPVIYIDVLRAGLCNRLGAGRTVW